MIKRIKDLLSNFSNQEEVIEDEKISSLDKACSALLIEVAYADKVFDESEINSLRESLKETYDIDEQIIDELISEAKKTVDESTSLYEYTRVVNDEFNYSDKLELLSRIWKLAFADGDLDKYEDHIIRKISFNSCKPFWFYKN